MSTPVVVVTGGHGFVGWHLRIALQAAGLDSLALGRNEELPVVLAPSVLVHAAGVNRADSDDEIESGNLAAAKYAIAAMARMENLSAVIYLNSTQAGNGSVYGAAKEASGELLRTAAASHGVRFVDAVLPGVYGEFGKPNYNSFVATFCDLIVQGKTPNVTNDREIELVHTFDLTDQLLRLITGDCSGTVKIEGTSQKISEVASRLKRFYDQYLEHRVVPNLVDPLDRRLFATLRSFLFPQEYPLPLDPKRDNRGYLFETLRVGSGGQSFVSWTHPGITRGNHFHRLKFERFLVLSGQAEIKFRRLFHEEVVTFEVSGAEPVAVDIPTLHTHSITNVGDTELITMFWTDEFFNPDLPDTYPEQVVRLA